MSLYEKYLPKVPCVYEKRWAKINAFGDTKIPQKLRKCDVCGRRFLSGTMSVERGYVVGARCIKHIASMLVIGIIIAMTSPGRIGLRPVEMEIEKRRAETGATLIVPPAINPGGIGRGDAIT